MMRVATIDIGTNTILMLIAEIDKVNNFNIIREEFAIARLGEGVDKSGIINENAFNRAENILVKYRKICSEYKVEIIKTVGTSALRDAKNNIDIINRFQKILGFPIDIISGEKEALLSYLGTVTDNSESVVIDIGGGSTEIIAGENGIIKNRISLNIGAVRITEKFFDSQPPNEEAILYASDYINDILINSNLQPVNCKVYAVAGTATTIATASFGLDDNDVASIHNKILTKTLIDDIYLQFKALNSEQLIDKFKVSPKRADLITAGALILKLILENMKIQKVIVSAHGLRYGILKDYLANFSA